MTSAVRLEVSKPRTFSSATVSLFSFAIRPAVAAANARPKLPVVPVCGLFAFLVPNTKEVDCDTIGNKGFDSLDLTSNDGIGNAPNVKGVAALLPAVSPLLVSPKLLLDETFVEADDPRLLKLPNGKLVEDGFVAAAVRLNRLLELEVLARDTAMELTAAFWLKTVPKTGVEAWSGPAAKMLGDAVLTETSALDSLFPNPKPKTLLVDGTMAEELSPEK